MPDYEPQLSLARAVIGGHRVVNKFGCSTNVDAVDTDIWDRANATDDQDIWTAPTQARVHAIASSSASDDGDPAGVGARTLRVYGLTDWDTDEVSEDIILDGTTPVNTINSYVIIHRMEVLTKGGTSANVGVITATAATDSTVTAQINAGYGQTQMAIYGIPSTHTAYCTHYYASVIKGATGVTAQIDLLINPEPDAELTNFLTKHLNAVASDGSTHAVHTFSPYFSIPGPAIVKLQANGSTTNLTVTGGFDLIKVRN